MQPNTSLGILKRDKLVKESVCGCGGVRWEILDMGSNLVRILRLAERYIEELCCIVRFQ